MPSIVFIGLQPLNCVLIRAALKIHRKTAALAVYWTSVVISFRDKECGPQKGLKLCFTKAASVLVSSWLDQ